MIQHSVMATPWVKDKLRTSLGVTVSQRLLYTAASSLALLFCIVKWQAIPETGLWVVDTSERWYLWLLFLLLHVLAWFLWSLQVTIMDAGEMLGITQVYNYYKGRPQPLTTGISSEKLQDLYSHWRHPGTLLISVLLWVHPLMMLDRVLLACWFSCYMVYRHSTTEKHYAFAQKEFSKTFTQTQTASHVAYDYIEG
ncbi:Nurim-like protein [Elysia marginata]|uniref:Nuclear envelope membrane protein n=1 Tax=Elysia marginata TaxID=1093978 RepID=A0AAV4HZL2_9GAST|nr:Nurim-like protein [Elysia marginata]